MGWLCVCIGGTIRPCARGFGAATPNPHCRSASSGAAMLLLLPRQAPSPAIPGQEETSKSRALPSDRRRLQSFRCFFLDGDSCLVKPTAALRFSPEATITTGPSFRDADAVSCALRNFASSSFAFLRSCCPSLPLFSHSAPLPLIRLPSRSLPGPASQFSEGLSQHGHFDLAPFRKLAVSRWTGIAKQTRRWEGRPRAKKGG